MARRKRKGGSTAEDSPPAPKIPPHFGEAPTLRTWNQALPSKGVVSVFGDRDRGKSSLAWSLATAAHEKDGKRVVGFGIPSEARRFFPDWVEHVAGNLDQLRQHRDCVAIVDEASLRAHARRTQSKENLESGRLVSISRQAHQTIFFIAQHARQLDVNIVGDSNLIVFKKPSILHIRFARPELRADIQFAWDILSHKGGKGTSLAMSYSEGAWGTLTNKPPRWWSEAFSLAETGELRERPTTRRRLNALG